MAKMNIGKVRAAHHIDQHISSFVFAFASFFEFHPCDITTQANYLTR